MHGSVIRLVGVLSGTSADAIDVAVVEALEMARPRLCFFRKHPMPQRLREPILRLAEPGPNEIDALGQLDRALGEAIAAAVLASLEEAQLSPAEITAIGSHGQTVRHRPHLHHPFSLQVGCLSTIAERTGITTVGDFRRRDLAAGGEGAPLMPLVHRQLFQPDQGCLAVLNIGGIANVTWIDAQSTVIAFDIGPGNMIMDGLMLAISNGRVAYDKDGTLAAMGKVNAALLSELLEHPYFERTPPKSCGREEFGRPMISRILACDMNEADRLRTALELTAISIAASRSHMPAAPDRWIVCGGGAHNPTLMRRLSDLLAPAEVIASDNLGIPAKAIEAMGFAMLALNALAGKPNTLACATGAEHAVCAGHIAPGKNWPEILRGFSWIR